MWTNSKENANLVTFTKEISNKKLYFSRSAVHIP